MRRGRRRIHVGQLNGRRGRRSVGHGRTVITGVTAAAAAASAAVAAARVGRISAAVTSTASVAAAAATAASAAATGTGRRRIDVRAAAVSAVRRVRRRRARSVAAASRRHTAALTATVVICMGTNVRAVLLYSLSRISGHVVYGSQKTSGEGKLFPFLPCRAPRPSSARSTVTFLPSWPHQTLSVRQVMATEYI